MCKEIIKAHKILLIVMLIIVAFVQGETYSENSKLTNSGFQNQLLPPSSQFESYFLTKNNTRVMAQLGGVAVLPCKLKYNSPATVSWIRRRDFQLLTVGLSTHSSDERFLIEHLRHMGHWSLIIKSVRDIDKGLYECQLSIYPTQSIFVELDVVEAITEISGAPDLHIDEGSTLRLECKLKYATEYPIFVFWYHNNNMINYDTQSGFTVTTLESTNYFYNQYNNINSNNNNNVNNSLYVNNNNYNSNNNYSNSKNYDYDYPSGAEPTKRILLEKYETGAHQSAAGQQPPSSHLVVASISILTIKEVHSKHAGNYTCVPSNAKLSSIMVHVLRGEKPAAIQHSNRSTIDENTKLSLSSSSSSSSSASTLHVTASPTLLSSIFSSSTTTTTTATTLIIKIIKFSINIKLILYFFNLIFIFL